MKQYLIHWEEKKYNDRYYYNRLLWAENKQEAREFTAAHVANNHRLPGGKVPHIFALRITVATKGEIDAFKKGYACTETCDRDIKWATAISKAR